MNLLTFPESDRSPFHSSSRIDRLRVFVVVRSRLKEDCWVLKPMGRTVALQGGLAKKMSLFRKSHWWELRTRRSLDMT